MYGLRASCSRSAAIDGVIGVAHGAARLRTALEGNECRLHARTKALHEILLAVEIDDEVRKRLELRIVGELAEDRRLGLAGRAPRRVHRDEDGTAGLLRLGKGLGIERFRARGKRGREQGGTRGERCQDQH